MNKILQFRITLNHSKPLIWRRIQVESNATFLELHIAIQLAMGWTNSHLFEFMDREKTFCLPSEENDLFDKEKLNASEERIENYFKEAGDEITYLYDFGDSWEHQVVLEKTVPIQKDMKYPVCVAGAMNCPHEDSGGLHGFYEKLEIIQDEHHPEYREIITWLGKKYDPFLFDMDKVNKQLAKTAKYLKEMFE